VCNRSATCRPESRVWGKPVVVSTVNPAAFNSGPFTQVKAQSYLPRPGISGAAWETTMKGPRREMEEFPSLLEGMCCQSLVLARRRAAWLAAVVYTCCVLGRRLGVRHARDANSAKQTRQDPAGVPIWGLRGRRGGSD
jgi:hypothetical protein